MPNLVRLTLIIALLCLAFCVGGYIAQQTTEPELIQVIEYVDRPVEVPVPFEVERIVEVEKIVEVEVPVPIKVREFKDLSELKQFLKDDDTDSHIHLYPIRGTDGKMMFDGTCDYSAMQLQERALEAGYLMSTEIIRKSGEDHMICSAVIGNEIYFIEPIDDEVWLWGYRRR